MDRAGRVGYLGDVGHKYRVKICGITNLEDALAAERLGADYVGVVVEVPYTRRSLTAQQAQPIFREVTIPRVALLMEPTRERFGELIEVLQPDAVQLLGRETVEDVAELKASQVPLWKSLHLPPAEAAEAVDLEGLRAAMHVYARAGAAMFVLDTKNTVSGVTHYGGTGLVSDWNLARELVKDAPLPVMLAGGLGPENVAQAVVHFVENDFVTGVCLPVDGGRTIYAIDSGG